MYLPLIAVGFDKKSIKSTEVREGIFECHRAGILHTDEDSKQAEVLTTATVISKTLICTSCSTDTRATNEMAPF